MQRTHYHYPELDQMLADMENAVWTLDEGSWNAGDAYITAVAPEE